MEKRFGCADWESYIPTPVCEEHPEYYEFYKKAWELAFAHIKDIPGMPQTPYMDEAFCDTQVWIWDTCFMTLFCKYAQDVFPGVETLNNFYEALYGGKPLPEVIPPENEPFWTGATPGVPYNIKVHLADNPPLFAWAEYVNALVRGDAEYLRELLYDKGVLQKHYEWIESLRESVKLPNVLLPTCLTAEKYGYRWEGGCSGMDNTPRGRTTEHAQGQRPNNPEMLWIDAICQQALSADIISEMFALVGDAENAELWRARYDEKKDIINSVYWDEEDGFYYDVDRRDHSFYKVMTTASYWALTSGVASGEQAEKLALRVDEPETMGGDVPLLSLSRSDNDFESDGLYWRGSLWMPTAYASLCGLVRYGFYDVAHRAGVKILEHMYKTYTDYEPHTIWECYSPTKPEPASAETHDHKCRPNFCGWSALGPISIYIECVLGFHTVNAFERRVEWSHPKESWGKVGIKGLRFGDVKTDILSDGKKCTVTSSAPYTLVIDGKEHKIAAGENEITL